MVPVVDDVAVSSVSSRIFSLGFMWSRVLRGLLSCSAATALNAPPSHGVFGLESRLSLALRVDGLADGLAACVHASIIRVAASEPSADPFGAPVPVGPGLDLVPQRGAGHDLAWLGTSGAVGGHLPGAVRSVHAADLADVAARLAADGAGRPAEGPGDGAHAVPGTVHVGDGDALVHVATVPVRERPLVAAGGVCPAVASGLPGAFGRAGRVGGLGEVHAAARQVRVLRASRRLHVPQLLVLGPVELVHHVSIPSESKVLRRSLEPAPSYLLIFPPDSAS